MFAFHQKELSSTGSTAWIHRQTRFRLAVGGFGGEKVESLLKGWLSIVDTSPFLFIRGLSCPRSVQTPLTTDFLTTSLLFLVF
jgi:hypothetical protein